MQGGGTVRLAAEGEFGNSVARGVKNETLVRPFFKRAEPPLQQQFDQEHDDQRKVW